jgi:glutamine amidotransferase
MIAVVDYGLGNIQSVSSALKAVGAEVYVTGDPDRIADADALVVPGVGAFRKAMENIKNAGLYEPLLHWLESGKPYLGICLGMQMLFTESYEYGNTPGFGFISGKVIKFGDDVKIPHMGWNQVRYPRGSRMFDGIKRDSFFYFDHSYHTVPLEKDVCSGVTDYKEDFVSAVESGAVWGVQFHPEKSSATGLRLLENFVKKC